MTSPLILFLLLVTSDLTNSQGFASSVSNKKVVPDSHIETGSTSGSSNSKNTTQHRGKPHIDPTLEKMSRDNRSGRSVDTVLAALVEFSKDPTLWRFVHSLVDELDFSIRANQSHSTASPPHTRPIMHIARPYYLHNNNNNNNSNSFISTKHNTQQLRNERHNNNPTAIRITKPPLLPWLQQPPEEPYLTAADGGRGGNQRTQQETQSSSNSNKATLSEQHTSKVNFVQSTLAPPSSAHFFFHRVFLEKTFDNNTRHTYRRPILALTARDIHSATASRDGKRNETTSMTLSPGNSSIGVSNSTTTKELEDKFDSLPATIFESEGKVLEDGDVRMVLSTEGDDGSRDQHINKHHHHHRHKEHNSFRSQLQYFQRWEERLWKRAHQKQDQIHGEHHNHHNQHHYHHITRPVTPPPPPS